MEKLSVTIITLNEESDLPAAIASVSWADEIVVLDSGSTDDTVRVASDLGARVYHQEWLGFVGQKNAAADLAMNNIILNIDADERVTDGLAREIRWLLVRNEEPILLEVPRLSTFMGDYHRGVHRPTTEYLIRLYDRRVAGFSGDHVHEKVRPLAFAQPKRSQEALLHHGYVDFAEAIQTLNRDSSLMARERLKNETRPSMVVRPIVRFLWVFVWRGHYRDGRRGLALSVFWAFHDFATAVKVHEATDQVSSEAGPTKFGKKFLERFKTRKL